MSNKNNHPQGSVIAMWANGCGFLGAALTRSVWGAIIGAVIGAALAFFLASNEA